MSLQTPTTSEISDNIVASLESSLGQTFPFLPKSFIAVLASALAAVHVTLYKYAGATYLDMFIQTATYGDVDVNGQTVNPLVNWGRTFGVSDPTTATRAELTVLVTVELQTGSLPSGAQLLGSPNGVTYITIGDVLLNAPTVTVSVRAVSDQSGGGGAGAIGNLSPGDELTFANPLANVNRLVTVITQDVTGADAESEDAYRDRVIERAQQRPQGGAYADYNQWGSEVPGILNVFPYTSDCAGQVDVYCEATPESSGSPDGIPTTAQLQAVKDSIELDESGLATRRPMGALVNTFPIARLGFEVTVVGINVPNFAETQTAIEATVNEYFAEREPFIVGRDVAPRRDQITRSALAGRVDGIVAAAGGTFTSVGLVYASISIEAYTLGIGEMAKASVIDIS